MTKDDKVHDLKVWSAYYEHSIDESKRFEIRYDHRFYAEGDYLRLREFDPMILKYTGRWILVRITYILHDFDGLREGWVILGLGDILARSQINGY